MDNTPTTNDDDNPLQTPQQSFLSLTSNDGLDEEGTEDATETEAETEVQQYNDDIDVQQDDDQQQERPTIPHYLTRVPQRNDADINWAYVAEDENEEGDGGDSDVEAEDADFHEDAFREVMLERASDFMEGEDNEQLVEDNDETAIMLHRGLMSNVEARCLELPGTPLDWFPPRRQEEKGEPEFIDVLNPGGWTNFTFRPEFVKGRYVRHSLPTGCTPVPPNAEGKHIHGEWEFFYKGWKASIEDDSFRSGATSADMFPQSRRGCLDAVLLRRLGLTKKRIEDRDALFFFQLLFPLCDPKRSGYRGDPRMAFYSEIENYSNTYAFSIGMGGSYGHSFKLLKLAELVHFDGVVIRDGVRGGSNGALYRRWQNDCADYDDVIANAMKYHRFLQIKRVIKLCNHLVAPKKGECGYNPAYKYDLIYKVLFHNINAVSKYAELDQTGDETTWGHGGFGEAGSGLVGRVRDKPGKTKGGQIVLISDVHRVRPRVYEHRHKLHEKPAGWTIMGQIEVRLVMQKVAAMVINNDHDEVLNHVATRKVFRERPHSTWDNYFSGDKVLNWLGANNFAATMTCRRDRLPGEVPGEYFHKKKTDASQRSKAARFLSPVVAVMRNETDDVEYVRMHCSFQSTSSCNFTTVNALNECDLEVRRKERGRKESKRYWGIEMNDARKLYLGTYSRIDSIDHLIKNAHLFYRSWKYWHSPMLHAKALGALVAWDMYREVTEGDLDPDWKDSNPMDYYTFRDKLSQQMLGYVPTARKYPGDELMRASTQQHNNRRSEETNNDTEVASSGRSRGRPSSRQGNVEVEQQTGRVTVVQLKRAQSGRGGNSRLCGDLSGLQRHIASAKTGNKHPKNCKVCGEPAYSECTLCQVPLHYVTQRGSGAGKQCFFQWHDETFFGLCKEDCTLINKRKAEWEFPTLSKQRENQRFIRALNLWSNNQTPNS
jgi:hypothetical protein